MGSVLGGIQCSMGRAACGSDRESMWRRSVGDGLNKNGNLMFRRVGRSLVAMRHPHPDPDQAPLTACTGRVSHDRTIES